MGHSIKKTAVIVLIVSLVLLTFLAILAIWDVLNDDIAWKSVTTMFVITFSSLVAIAVGKNLETKENKLPPPSLPKQ